MTTREAILNAAKEEFFAKGYDATRMRSIADRAEINKGLLHYYFKTKDALIIEIFQENFKVLFAKIDEIFQKEDDLFAIIHSIVDTYLDFMIQNPGLPTFVINEMRRNQKQHHTRMKKAGVKPPFRGLNDAFKRAKEQGKIREDASPRHFIISMMSLILFPMVARPMIKFMQNLNDDEFDTIVIERKQLIIHTLIESIKAK